ncbi:MAG: serine protease [Kibdelosporangium sp.]
MRKILWAAATAALVVFPGPAAAQPSSPEELAAAVARPAMVFIEVTWHGWVRDKQTGEVFGGTAGYQVKTRCSGVVIDPSGYVATASHCVHTGIHGGGGALLDAAIAELGKAGRIGDPVKAKQALAKNALAEGALPDRPVVRQIQVARMVPDGDGLKRDVAIATVVDLVAPDNGDVAVLKVPRARWPAIELRTDAAPVGTPILAIGYPGSVPDPNLEPSNKNGQISAHRTQQKWPYYEFSAAAASGMSGGPVIDTQGRVVGLISQGTPGETQSFNFATATSTLSDLLRRKEITVGLGPNDRNFRTGLDRYFAGDADAAVDYFDAVVKGAPTHVQAAEFRRRAAEKGGTPSSGGTLLVVFTLVCAGIAVVAAGLGVLLIVRRRRLVSTMDTPPYGIPLLPAGLGDQPQRDRQYDADQTERRQVTLREDQADDQTQARDTEISPWSPPTSEPRTDKADHGDGAEDSTERHSL